ncbi:MAG TPA: hypothetical protein VHT05_01300 [Candidatus Elarobacter sp.]|jgi:hypothetical protein|nr:hypothetical protein [Candidatus Elarobacter sp.]
MRLLSTLRTPAAVAALVAAAALPIAASAASFAGTWTFTGTFVLKNASYVTAPVCVLRQTGNALAGSCKGPNAIGSANGVVSGRTIMLQWHAIGKKGSGVATMKGTWGADGVVRGTITSTQVPGVGTLTGQKV